MDIVNMSSSSILHNRSSLLPPPGGGVGLEYPILPYHYYSGPNGRIGDWPPLPPRLRHIRVRQNTRMKPYRRHNYMTEEVEECDGLENLIDDIEIISLFLGFLSLLKGVFSLFATTYALIFKKINTYFVLVPSRIITILRMVGIELPAIVDNTFAWLEIIFTGLDVFLFLPYEIFSNFVHLIAEAIAAVSLKLAGITTFSKQWKPIYEIFASRKTKGFIDNYGCSTGLKNFPEFLDAMEWLSKMSDRRSNWRNG